MRGRAERRCLLCDLARRTLTGMALHGRLLALLVAVLCAVGWVRTERPSGPDEGLAAGDDIGLLPARRQHASGAAADVDDDQPLWWEPGVAREDSNDIGPMQAVAPASEDPLVDRDRSPFRQRGPPSLA